MTMMMSLSPSHRSVVVLLIVLCLAVQGVVGQACSSDAECQTKGRTRHICKFPDGVSQQAGGEPAGQCGCADGWEDHDTDGPCRQLKAHIEIPSGLSSSIVTVAAIGSIIAGWMISTSGVSQAAAGTARQKQHSWLGLYGALPNILYLQMFIMVMSNNNLFVDHLDPFRFENVFLGNGPGTDAASTTDNEYNRYHGLYRKLFVLIGIIFLYNWLPGRVLETCCFTTLSRKSHFVVLFVLLLMPVLESVYLIELPNWVIIVQSATLLCLIWFFVYFRVSPLVEKELRAFMAQGKGWSGISHREVSRDIAKQEATKFIDELTASWRSVRRQFRCVRPSARLEDADRAKAMTLTMYTSAAEVDGDALLTELGLGDYVREKRLKDQQRLEERQRRLAAAKEKKQREMDRIRADLESSSKKKSKKKRKHKKKSRKKKSSSRRLQEDSDDNREGHIADGTQLDGGTRYDMYADEDSGLYTGRQSARQHHTVDIREAMGAVNTGSTPNGNADGSVEADDLLYDHMEDRWTRFEHIEFFHEVVSYRPYKPKYLGRVPPFLWYLRLVRSHVSHYWAFVELSLIVVFSGIAMALEGEEQLMTLAILMVVYLLLLLFIMPYRDHLMMQKLYIYTILTGQLYFLLRVVRDPGEAFWLTGIAFSQIGILPVRWVAWQAFNDEAELAAHRQRVRRRIAIRLIKGGAQQTMKELSFTGRQSSQSRLESVDEFDPQSSARVGEASTMGTSRLSMGTSSSKLDIDMKERVEARKRAEIMKHGRLKRAESLGEKIAERRRRREASMKELNIELVERNTDGTSAAATKKGKSTRSDSETRSVDRGAGLEQGQGERSVSSLGDRDAPDDNNTTSTKKKRKKTKTKTKKEDESEAERKEQEQQEEEQQQQQQEEEEEQQETKPSKKKQPKKKLQTTSTTTTAADGDEDSFLESVIDDEDDEDADEDDEEEELPKIKLPPMPVKFHADGVTRYWHLRDVAKHVIRGIRLRKYAEDVRRRAKARRRKEARQLKAKRKEQLRKKRQASAASGHTVAVTAIVRDNNSGFDLFQMIPTADVDDDDNGSAAAVTPARNSLRADVYSDSDSGSADQDDDEMEFRTYGATDNRGQFIPHGNSITNLLRAQQQKTRRTRSNSKSAKRR